MNWRPPRVTRSDTLFPSRTLCRSRCGIAAGFAIVARQAGAGEKGLDAALLAAVAGRAAQLLRRRPGQGIVAPLAGDGIAADERPAGHHDAAADSGSQDDAEHHGEARGGAVGGFRERKAVGVVHQPHRTARSEEHTSELQSLMRLSYAVFCLKKKTL